MWSHFRSIQKPKTVTRQRKKKQRPNFKLSRMDMEIKLRNNRSLGDQSEVVIPGRLFLNDFAPKCLRVITTQPLQMDQKVSITFDYPRRFYVQGRVTWCRYFPHNAQIVTDQQYKYRMEIEFDLKTEVERLELSQIALEVLRFSQNIPKNQVG